MEAAAVAEEASSCDRVGRHRRGLHLAFRVPAVVVEAAVRQCEGQRLAAEGAVVAHRPVGQPRPGRVLVAVVVAGQMSIPPREKARRWQ